MGAAAICGSDGSDGRVGCGDFCVAPLELGLMNGDWGGILLNEQAPHVRSG